MTERKTHIITPALIATLTLAILFAGVFLLQIGLVRADAGYNFQAETVWETNQLPDGSYEVVAKEIILRWSDLADDRAGYVIERQANGGSWSELTTVSPGSDSYTDTNIAPNTDYNYRIAADGLTASETTTTDEDDIDPFEALVADDTVFAVPDVTPIRQLATETANVAPTLGFGAAAALWLAAVLQPISLLHPLARIASLLGLLFHRRTKHTWGTVFDASTHEPLAGASVKLMDAEGEVKDRTTTNYDGRYGFLVQPGTYTITASKGDYELSSFTNYDTLYGALYSGQPFTIEESTMVSLSIGLSGPHSIADRVKRGARRFWVKQFITVVGRTLFILGFIAAVADLIVQTDTRSILTVVAYAVLLSVGYWAMRKRHGTVTRFESDAAVPFATVTLHKPEDKDARHAFTVSDEMGRYVLFVEDGNYILRAVAQLVTGEKVVAEKSVTAKGGMVRENIEVTTAV